MSTVNPAPLYRDRDWLYNELITLGKSEKQVAEENQWTLRVIQKWAQIYQLGENNFRELKNLSDAQRSLIRASILGDGHITSEGIFIVSHCEQQRDYLFWKYHILQDCCKTAPSYYPGDSAHEIRGALYNRQGAYRFNTRKIRQIEHMRGALTRPELIRSLTPFEFAVWMLDDGYRDVWTWDLCVGDTSPENVEAVADLCARWGLTYKARTDRRYVRFHNAATRAIDEMILANVPTQMDIVRAKILTRR